MSRVLVIRFVCCAALETLLYNCQLDREAYAAPLFNQPPPNGFFRFVKQVFPRWIGVIEPAVQDFKGNPKFQSATNSKHSEKVFQLKFNFVYFFMKNMIPFLIFV